jgi:AcrR family transcriptional regulator
VAGIKAHPRDRSMLEDYRILKRRGLSMQEIAAEMGVSRATLYRMVREWMP